MDSITTASPCAAPDWSTQTEEIHCPLCEYNLRGLSEPRCPECGHRFEWVKLLDPAQRVHPYLFEHHPRKNLWSYCRTAAGAMLPGRFWRSLLPIQRVDGRRIMIYWLVSLPVLTLIFAVPYLDTAMRHAAAVRLNRMVWQTNWQANPSTAQHFINTYGSIAAALDEYLPLPPRWGFFREVLQFSPIRALGTVLIAFALWPWTAVGTLMIFRASMHRARINSMHVLRCTVYSADPGPVLAAAVVFLGFPAFDRLYPGVLPSLNDPWLWWLTLMVAWGLVTWRLMQAYRLYLRFPHTIGVVLSLQVIFLLLAAQVIVLVQGYLGVERIVSPWRW